MTEKQYAPTKNEKKIVDKKINENKMNLQKTASQKNEITEKSSAQAEAKVNEPKASENKKDDRKKEKIDEKQEPKKPVQKKPKVKKIEAIVNAKNLPISTKKSAAFCKFIKNKPIERAVTDLQEVFAMKKAVPIKGEIAHQKGKRMMSGIFSKKTAEHFLKLIKSLGANANFHDIENPIIIEAVANKAPRPLGKFGRVQRKRTHVKIRAKSKDETKQKVKK